MLSEPKDPLATATASALHRFNRYEIKYFLPESSIQEFRDKVSARMSEDAHANELSLLRYQ